MSLLDKVVNRPDEIKVTLDALKGAENMIRLRRPHMAICVYHRPEDLYTIPQYIYSLNKSYQFFLRFYGPGTRELVFYAINKS